MSAHNKSLFKRPGTKHFQLVHRSQRDPLINDPEASDRVLKEIGESQTKSKNTIPSLPEAKEESEDSIEDAAAYGIYYDDTAYNYLQHLRPVGGTHDSILLEAPSTKKGKGKQRRGEYQIEVKESPRILALPEESLPSHPLDEVPYEEYTASKKVNTGLQPDLNPSVREVLEALDDDEYAVDDGEGTDNEQDFWSHVVEGGEIEEGEEEDHANWNDDHVNGISDKTKDLRLEDTSIEPQQGWEADFAKFKAKENLENGYSSNDDEEEFGSEGGDTIADLRASNARRPARKAASQAGSQFSMTSSAMHRNEGLRTLDDRFDQIEKLYEEDSDSSWGSQSDEEDDQSSDKHEQKPIREDIEQIMDDFLSRYEVLGGKMRPVLEPLEGTEGASGKLERIRRELAKVDLGDVQDNEDPVKAAHRAEKERILAAVERQQREDDGRKGNYRIKSEKEKDRWDCETVLSTYSNVSNHPRLLRIREEGMPRGPRIKIDPKTGFPLVDGVAQKSLHPRDEVEDEHMEELDDSEYLTRPETVTRARGETPEDRRARKAAVKADRSARRVEKKNTKEAFGSETKRQKRVANKALAGGGAADVRVGDGVRHLA